MIAIKLKKIGKCFDTPKRNKSLIKTLVSQLVSCEKNKLWALKDINFDIQKGDCVGIIGDNGSGKSTLLKIIAGITTPSKGNILINGKIGSFLELGIGFQGELSGEENIFLYGLLLGIKKNDIKKNYKQIIEFSELKEAIHHPIKTYSSGMLARLAFSVLAFTNPDVLLLDEVATVGDHSFKQKCLNKLREFKRKGKTILMVSHNISELLKICDKCILLENGCLKSFGDIRSVSGGYINETNQKNKLKLLNQIKKEGSENSDNTRLLCLYNELDIILENITILSKEKTLYDHSNESIENIYDNILKQYEERSEILKKILDCYKKENPHSKHLSIVYQNLLGVLGEIQAIYERKFNNIKFYDKRTANYKEQIDLLKEAIKTYTHPYDHHKIIKYYEKLTDITLRYSEINKIKQKQVLSDLKQVLKNGLKENESSENLLKCFIRVTEELINISTEKEKKGLLTELKIYDYNNIKNIKRMPLKRGIVL